MKRWVIVVALLLAIAVVTHLWGSRLIGFADANARHVDSVKNLVELLALLAGFGVTFVKWGFGGSGKQNIQELPSLPQFTMIRPFPPDQPEDRSPWTQVDNSDEFHRNFEFAADPVFDLALENKSRHKVLVYGVGVRLLQRKAGVGGTMGYPQSVPVQAKFRVRCPDGWKQVWGVTDAKSRPAEFDDPIEIREGDSPFRFTLMLENFCDPDHASTCEVRFYLETSNGTVESRSIWLTQ